LNERAQGANKTPQGPGKKKEPQEARRGELLSEESVDLVAKESKSKGTSCKPIDKGGDLEGRNILERTCWD